MPVTSHKDNQERIAAGRPAGCGCSPLCFGPMSCSLVQVDLDQPYLKRQLIANIGNKRALQPFLLHNFGRLIDPTEGSKVFLDLFAGSGSVARLARAMGFQVPANDWEFYAYVLNTAHLQNETETRDFYQARGGLARGDR